MRGVASTDKKTASKILLHGRPSSGVFRTRQSEVDINIGQILTESASARDPYMTIYVPSEKKSRKCTPRHKSSAKKNGSVKKIKSVRMFSGIDMNASKSRSRSS